MPDAGYPEAVDARQDAKPAVPGWIPSRPEVGFGLRAQGEHPRSYPAGDSRKVPGSAIRSQYEPDMGPSAGTDYFQRKLQGQSEPVQETRAGAIFVPIG